MRRESEFEKERMKERNAADGYTFIHIYDLSLAGWKLYKERSSATASHVPYAYIVELLRENLFFFLTFPPCFSFLFRSLFQEREMDNPHIASSGFKSREGNLEQCQSSFAKRETNERFSAYFIYKNEILFMKIKFVKQRIFMKYIFSV